MSPVLSVHRLATPLSTSIFLAMGALMKEKTLAHGYTFVEALDPGRDSISVALEIGKVMTPWEEGSSSC